MSLIVVRYSEIALKGKNRNWFEKLLLKNIHSHLKNLGSVKITRIHGRIILETEVDWDPVKTALMHVPGIANFSLTIAATHDIEGISTAALELMGAYLEKQGNSAARFKVESRRSEKRFPMNSIELSTQIGGDLLQAFPELTVDLHTPEIQLGIEVWPKDRAILYLEKIPGQGGLPVGSGGNVISFLSGGIDSPVSSWFMMNRGCKTIFLYFHSHPFTGEQSRQKVVDLVTHLSRYQPYSKLLIVPFTEIQKSIRENCGEQYRTILYRRLMFHIGNKIRRQHKALGYVTGEAVGQVASQTLENIACTEDVAELPVLRPLIGMEKAQIINYARDIGTYPISIQPFPDACTVFQPKKPEIHGSIPVLRKEESRIPLEELLKQTIEGIETLTFETAVQNQFWE